MEFECRKNRTRGEALPIVLLVTSVLLGFMVLAQVVSFYGSSAEAESLLDRAIGRSNGDPNGVKKTVAKSKTVADELKKKNLFVTPPPRQHPVKQVTGIMGDEALIEGNWYKVGGKIADAKIVAIGPTRVEIEWDGSIKPFAPIGATAAAGAPPAPDTDKRGPEKVEAKQVKTPDKTIKAEVAGGPMDDDPLAWMGVKLSPRMREMLMQKWSQASDEEKAKAKEEWGKMPDEQKQQAVGAMEQNL